MLPLLGYFSCCMLLMFAIIAAFLLGSEVTKKMGDHVKLRNAFLISISLLLVSIALVLVGYALDFDNPVLILSLFAVETALLRLVFLISMTLKSIYV